MKKIFFIIVQLVAICPVLAQSNTRLIVTTDIGGSDPDDIQSLVHLMVMLNDVDLEGIISQHAWVPYGTGADSIINGVIDAYEDVLPNLIVHDKRYPDANVIREMVKTGQPQAAMACMGGKTIHIILKVSDNALPNLCSYRRIVINVKG